MSVDFGNDQNTTAGQSLALLNCKIPHRKVPKRIIQTYEMALRYDSAAEFHRALPEQSEPDLAVVFHDFWDYYRIARKLTKPCARQGSVGRAGCVNPAKCPKWSIPASQPYERLEK
jgi:hypothetical protein